MIDVLNVCAHLTERHSVSATFTRLKISWHVCIQQVGTFETKSGSSCSFSETSGYYSSWVAADIV
jgi:hypothetical protein